MNKQEIKSIISMLKSPDEETQFLGIKMIQTAGWYKAMKPKEIFIVHKNGMWWKHEINNLSYVVGIRGTKLMAKTRIAWLESLIKPKDDIITFRKIKNNKL